jgi:hypothetical protein
LQTTNYGIASTTCFALFRSTAKLSLAMHDDFGSLERPDFQYR